MQKTKFRSERVQLAAEHVDNENAEAVAQVPGSRHTGCANALFENDKCYHCGKKAISRSSAAKGQTASRLGGPLLGEKVEERYRSSGEVPGRH